MRPGDAEAGLQGVVVRLAGGVLLQDVEGTVREIAADVVARHTIAGNTTWSTRGNTSCHAWACMCGTLRILETVVIRRGEGEIRRGNRCLPRLADVEEPPEAMPLRSNVADLQYCLAGNLLLDIQVVILHVRRLDVAVEGEDVALEAIRRTRRSIECSHNAAWVNRSAGREGFGNRNRTEVVICWAGIEEGRIGEMAKHHVLREGIVEHAETGADHGSTFSGYIPCSTHSRCEVFLVRVIQPAQARLTHLRDCKVTVGEIKTG